MTPTAKFTANDKAFSHLLNAKAIAFGISREQAFKDEGRLLCKELIERTPPFSGKAIVRMLGAQGKSLTFRNLEIEEMNARKVGERRVEKDIRRVILGVRGASWPEESPTVFVSQVNPRYARHSNKIEFGIRQKVQGKDAVRVYADKTGRVYGIDTEKFDPNATMADLGKWHQAGRTKNGRITTAGQLSKDVGRWKWLNKIATKEATVKKYIKRKLKNVGQAKGGWAAGFMRLGGKMTMSGWIGRHAAKYGRVRTMFTKDKTSIEIVNQSRWATGGDRQGIIARSLAGRAEALKGSIKRKMNDDWKAGQPKQ